jgi:hypothetical protein
MADGLKYQPDEDAPDVPASDELKQAAAEAFPDEDWSDERLGALKTLMKLCMGKDYGDDEPDGDEGDDKHAGLALLFGKPKK